MFENWIKITPKDSAFWSRGEGREKLKLNNSYKVLVWNVFKGKKKNWLGQFSDIQKEYDFMLLQEAAFNKADFNIKNIPSDYRMLFVESYTRKKDNTSTGVFIASCYQEKETWGEQAPVFEPIAKTPKCNIYSRYQFENSHKSLLMINAHFINFRTLKPFISQLLQVEKVLSTHQGPIIVAGDFNTWSQNRLKLLARVMARYELNPMPFLQDRRLFLKLDHVFTRGMQITRSRYLKDIKSSDHRPLSFDFTVFEE